MNPYISGIVSSIILLSVEHFLPKKIKGIWERHFIASVISVAIIVIGNYIYNLLCI